MAKTRKPRRADPLPTIETIVPILDKLTNIVGMQRFWLDVINRRLDALERPQRARRGHTAMPRRRAR